LKIKYVVLLQFSAGAGGGGGAALAAHAVLLTHTEHNLGPPPLGDCDSEQLNSAVLAARDRFPTWCKARCKER